MEISKISFVNTQMTNKTDTSVKQQNNIQSEPEKTENKTSSKMLSNYFKAGQSVNFGGGLSSFKIKKLEDVPCPCCGLVMLTPESTKKHVNRINLAKGNKLADRIENEEAPVLRSNERTCAMMAAKAARNTDLNLENSMKKVMENLPQNFNSICSDILLNASVLCDEELGENSEIGVFLLQKAESFNEPQKFYRPDLTTELEKFKANLSEEQYNKIEDAVLKLPLDYESVEKVMNSFNNASSTIIAQKLYAPSLATAEHVHPHSLGGKNQASNFLSECAGCNNPRSSMPYVDWLKIHPEFKRNPQVYIEHVESRIVNGDLPESYYSYPVDIKETLTNESEGHIRLKVLNKEKLTELRNAKKAGQEINIHEETEKTQVKNEE